jgi:NADH-quinone oxidoreductase subunit L
VSGSALPLLILGFPAAGAVLLAGRGWRWSRILTQFVGPGVVWLSFLVVVFAWLTGADSGIAGYTYWTWIRSGAFDLPVNLVIDHLSLFMCLVITGVGGLIVTYAVGYMEHETDPSYARFFCYMDVFVFSMLLLVLAGNFVFLIIGWALVGLSSYLLIGFYYWRLSAVLAARKAFVMNVVGDIGMILGTFVLFVNLHATTYQKVFAGVPKQDTGWLELAAFLMLVGGIAKSAQLPLHTWLPDAMEGPTPVSALIHAATMVTAGVYLVGRLHPIYDAAPLAHDAVAIVGAVSAFFAATVAIVQTDIKRVLAYSTMSQIGYMFLAVGIGAYAAGFFHLLSHAFFKALLFMSGGNVIHAMDDDQDMRHYGGLWPQLRTSSICFLVGALSLVGMLPLAGFFSKELVLGSAFSKPGGLPFYLWITGFVTALLTGFYTGRMWWLSFWGQPSSARPVEHPHEAPAVMMLPVAILTLLTVIGGLLQTTAIGFGTNFVRDFLAPVVGRPNWEGGAFEVLASVVTMALATLVFLVAYLWYVGLEERRARFWDRFAEVAVAHPRPWADRLPWLQSFLEHKWWFDELYDAVFVRPLDRLAGLGSRWIDRPLIEGSLTGVAEAVEDGAGGLSLVQSGYLRAYVLVFVFGVLVAGLILLYRGGVL